MSGQEDASGWSFKLELFFLSVVESTCFAVIHDIRLHNDVAVWKYHIKSTFTPSTLNKCWTDRSINRLHIWTFLPERRQIDCHQRLYMLWLVDLKHAKCLRAWDCKAIRLLIDGPEDYNSKMHCDSLCTLYFHVFQYHNVAEYHFCPSWLKYCFDEVTVLCICNKFNRFNNRQLEKLQHRVHIAMNCG